MGKKMLVPEPKPGQGMTQKKKKKGNKGIKKIIYI